MKIDFIGGGNMAAALISCLMAKGFPAERIRVIEIAAEARRRLSTSFGIQCYESAQHALPLAEVVVLAVKPQNMPALAKEIAPHIGNALVLSIAAGIRLTDLRRWLGVATLVRCMPNTPALIGAGISGVYAAPAVSETQREQAQIILQAVGRVVWVDRESLLDPITAVSGSGPAYVFYFMEAMQRGAIALGLSEEQARELVMETFRGAVELAARSDDSIAVLRERVTSKGGTTESALATMRAEQIEDAIVGAMKAACVRAAELGDELGHG